MKKRYFIVGILVIISLVIAVIVNNFVYGATTNTFTVNVLVNDSRMGQVRFASTQEAVVANPNATYIDSLTLTITTTSSSLKTSNTVANKVIDDRFKFSKWVSANSNVTIDSATDEKIKPTVKGDGTIVAVFEVDPAKCTSLTTINYQVESGKGGGTVVYPDKSYLSKDKDYVVDGESYITGALAVPNNGYYFAYWTKLKTDGSGKTENVVVSTNPTFVPEGSQIQDGVTYVAQFLRTSEHRVIFDKSEHGKVSTDPAGSDAAGTFVGLNSSSQLPNTYYAVPESDEFVFDHWELDGVTVSGGKNTKNGIEYDTIKGPFTIEDGKSPKLKAVFKPADNSLYKEVKYVAGEGGSVSGTSEYVKVGETALGATASACDGYEFVQWNKVDENGEFYSSEATIVPEVSEDETYYALFKKTELGKVKYNMNIANLDADSVSWTDGNDEFEGVVTKTSGANSPIFASRKTYPANGEDFVITDNIPKVEGYVFVGWFDKDRTSSSGSAAILRESGDTVNYIYNGNDYTLDAIWAVVDEAEDVSVEYDGESHTIEDVTAKIDTSVFELISDSSSYEKNYLLQLNDMSPEVTVRYLDSENGSEISKPYFVDVRGA